MTDIGIWAEWELEVELDPTALARGVQWAVGRLVDECRTEGVAPIGTLTIKDGTVAGFGDFRTVRRAVTLTVDPTVAWDWTVPEPRRRSWWARLWHKGL